MFTSDYDPENRAIGCLVYTIIILVSIIIAIWLI